MSGSDSANWFTNPLLGSIIGAVAGSVASFFFGYWSQKKENDRIKKEIRQFVKDDLNTYHDILNEILKKGNPQNDNPEIIHITDSMLSKKIFETMPDMDSSFRIKNFLDLTLETKAHVFDYNTLVTIEKIYKHIPTLRPSAGMNLFFYKKIVIELKNEIEKIISKI